MFKKIYIFKFAFFKIWNEIQQISCMISARFHLWNLLDSIHEICWILLPWNLADSTMKSTGFHAYNLPDFTMKSTRFHAWNLPDSTAMKSTGFQPWNPPDFIMKSAGFHHEIWQMSPSTPLPLNIQQISCEICQIPPWNLPDFTWTPLNI